MKNVYKDQRHRRSSGPTTTMPSDVASAKSFSNGGLSGTIANGTMTSSTAATGNAWKSATLATILRSNTSGACISTNCYNSSDPTARRPISICCKICIAPRLDRQQRRHCRPTAVFYGNALIFDAPGTGWWANDASSNNDPAVVSFAPDNPLTPRANCICIGSEPDASARPILEPRSGARAM